jgi:putative oxidoreductase
MKLLTKWEDYALFPLRLTIGGLFVFAGLSKALNLTGAAKMFAGFGFPAATTVVTFVMLAEIIGGLFLIFGLLTRYAAVWLSIILIVAFLVVGLRTAGSPGFMGALKDIALLGATITLILSGARRPSLDEYFLID